MKLETDLTRINRLAEEKENENIQFRAFLKGCDEPESRIDSLVHELYRKVSSEIDCKQCANCCRKTQPTLSRNDIRDFSEGLGMPFDKFKERYLVQGDTPDKSRFNRLPCPFLKGNLCANYDHRPHDCRSFPHLHKSDFTTRLWNVLENYSVCPIVFNVYECLKYEL